MHGACAAGFAGKAAASCEDSSFDGERDAELWPSQLVEICAGCGAGALGVPRPAIPGYALGWIIRLVAKRCEAVWLNFVGTLQSVIGDLFADATSKLGAAFTPSGDGSLNAGGFTLMAAAWMLMRRQ